MSIWKLLVQDYSHISWDSMGKAFIFVFNDTELNQTFSSFIVLPIGLLHNLTSPVKVTR